MIGLPVAWAADITACAGSPVSGPKYPRGTFAVGEREGRGRSGHAICDRHARTRVFTRAQGHEHAHEYEVHVRAHEYEDKRTRHGSTKKSKSLLGIRATCTSVLLELAQSTINGHTSHEKSRPRLPVGQATDEICLLETIGDDFCLARHVRIARTRTQRYANDKYGEDAGTCVRATRAHSCETEPLREVLPADRLDLREMFDVCSASGDSVGVAVL